MNTLSEALAELWQSSYEYMNYLLVVQVFVRIPSPSA